eukprot:3648593-Amphidinium_carterae.1
MTRKQGDHLPPRALPNLQKHHSSNQHHQTTRSITYCALGFYVPLVLEFDTMPTNTGCFV